MNRELESVFPAISRNDVKPNNFRLEIQQPSNHVASEPIPGKNESSSRAHVSFGNYDVRCSGDRGDCFYLPNTD